MEKPDIEKRTFSFGVRIIHLCKNIGRESDVHRILSRQLIRSATSVGANVVEAQAGQSKADFISKNAIALKEARETVYWLRLIQESQILTSPKIGEAVAEAEEISRILATIVFRARQNS